jgi:hypothetical protein
VTRFYRWILSVLSRSQIHPAREGRGKGTTREGLLHYPLSPNAVELRSPLPRSGGEGDDTPLNSTALPLGPLLPGQGQSEGIVLTFLSGDFLTAFSVLPGLHTRSAAVALMAELSLAIELQGVNNG